LDASVQQQLDASVQQQLDASVQQQLDASVQQRLDASVQQLDALEPTSSSSDPLCFGDTNVDNPSQEESDPPSLAPHPSDSLPRLFLPPVSSRPRASLLIPADFPGATSPRPSNASSASSPAASLRRSSSILDPQSAALRLFPHAKSSSESEAAAATSRPASRRPTITVLPPLYEAPRSEGRTAADADLAGADAEAASAVSLLLGSESEPADCALLDAEASSERDLSTSSGPSDVWDAQGSEAEACAPASRPRNPAPQPPSCDLGMECVSERC
ncbi:hypothetical protein H632_c4187p0, partial [Helicosporidium sp. ATCC 50920]